MALADLVILAYFDVDEGASFEPPVARQPVVVLPAIAHLQSCRLGAAAAHDGCDGGTQAVAPAVQERAAEGAAAGDARARRVGLELEEQQSPHRAAVDREDDAELRALATAQAVGEAPEVTRRVQGHAQLQPLVP